MTQTTTICKNCNEIKPIYQDSGLCINCDKAYKLGQQESIIIYDEPQMIARSKRDTLNEVINKLENIQDIIKLNDDEGLCKTKKIVKLVYNLELELKSKIQPLSGCLLEDSNAGDSEQGEKKLCAPSNDGQSVLPSEKSPVKPLLKKGFNSQNTKEVDKK